uniref:Antimicrobial peptide 1 n=1 Tax=Pithecopus hypochondrialis TaxID=317381 RepID=AMP1_PITHY|nr:RecName: Full=Antimicrobial peptide 1 [Pithecopus hypochondrialis]
LRPAVIVRTKAL